jgi:hypothetical protein
MAGGTFCDSWCSLPCLIIAILANHVGAAIVAGQDFVHPTGVHVHALAWAIGLHLVVLLVGVPERHLSLDDEMGCQRDVRVRGVMPTAKARNRHLVSFDPSLVMLVS